MKSIKILEHKKGNIVYRKDGVLNEFKLFSKRGEYVLKKKNTNAHKITLKVLIIEEAKKRNKILNDDTYKPSDLNTFINDIDTWRVRCYNAIGVI